MIRGLKSISLAAIGALALGGTPALAQQQPADSQQEQPTTPIPAIRSPLASAADNGDETANSQQLIPDTRSLTGAEDLSLGTIPLAHSYWQPRASLLVNVDSNPDYSTASDDWATWTILTAGVDIHHISGLSDLLLSYTGGGMFSNGGEAENGVIQELAFKDKFSFRRSTFSVFEQLSYLPESAFGFSGTAGALLPGTGGLGLGIGLTPGQSILTPRGQNLSNTSAVEYDYRLTARTSFTVLGSYALLHYYEDGLADYGGASFQAGYNYQLNRKDTIAVSYLFNAIRYSNENQSINANTVLLSYGRRVTGRLAFQIAAGPQFVSSTIPITGSAPTSSPATGSTSVLYWALNSSLQYQLRRALISATYVHGLTGGSGLLAGSEADIVTGSVGGQVRRTLNLTWIAGYSRNQGISVGTMPTVPTGQTYDYWFTGATVTHPIGRSLDLFLNYQLQYQENSLSGCVTSGCSPNVIRNQIAFGMNLHKQPIPF